MGRHSLESDEPMAETEVGFLALPAMDYVTAAPSETTVPEPPPPPPTFGFSVPVRSPGRAAAAETLWNLLFGAAPYALLAIAQWATGGTAAGFWKLTLTGAAPIVSCITLVGMAWVGIGTLPRTDVNNGARFVLGLMAFIYALIYGITVVRPVEEMPSPVLPFCVISGVILATVGSSLAVYQREEMRR